MAPIEHRVEADTVTPDYSITSISPSEASEGRHRRFVGGKWESHGRHQLDFLIEQGLQPSDLLVDIGCGALRAGRHFIDYLERGHYYGVEASPSLIQTGYDVELTDEQRAKTPEEHLRANDRFDVDFGVQFDVAIAQSVFTHLSLNHIRLCLYRLAPVMRPGGSFYATWFIRPPAYPLDEIGTSQKGRTYFSERNIFWYYRKDAEWAAQYGPWRFEWIGDWGHPVNQKMVRYVRLDEDAPTGPPSAGLVTRGRRWLARQIAP